eukprot:766311-Hanusia_phi.AAC.2
MEWTGYDHPTCETKYPTLPTSRSNRIALVRTLTDSMAATSRSRGNERGAEARRSRRAGSVSSE